MMRLKKMEIKELESFYINETSQTLDVTFRILSDNDDEIRTDQIDLSETKTFGYDFSKNDMENFCNIKNKTGLIKVLPIDFINNTLNLVTWLLLGFILVYGGGKIAEIGVKLVK